MPAPSAPRCAPASSTAATCAGVTSAATLSVFLSIEWWSTSSTSASIVGEVEQPVLDGAQGGSEDDDLARRGGVLRVPGPDDDRRIAVEVDKRQPPRTRVPLHRLLDCGDQIRAACGRARAAPGAAIRCGFARALRVRRRGRARGWGGGWRGRGWWQGRGGRGRGGGTLDCVGRRVVHDEEQRDCESARQRQDASRDRVKPRPSSRHRATVARSLQRQRCGRCVP